ncbi:MAG: hypothetical protein ACO36I_03785 [Candidatus Latescibacterota bacterium]
MLSKYVGIVLMVIGGEMAWGYLWPLLFDVIALVWQVIKLGMVLFVAYIGYRLWRQQYLQGV